MFQSETLPPVIRGLLDAAAYPHEARRIQLVQTHISYVLLAGHFAYKVKKPLDLGFLDYSTLDRRRQMCEEEVRLNRRLCTGVYLGVVPIALNGGRYAVEGAGTPVEYAVKMRRVPAERMMPSLLARGEVTSAHIRSLARTVAAFHEHAETSEAIATYGRVEGVRANWDENFEQVRPFFGRYLSAGDFARLQAYVAAYLRDFADLIETRAASGRTRDVHGDLRADSVVFDDERATCIMDCIEFDERIRYGDVASDVAFLAMDLEARGFRSLADEFVAFYVERMTDETLTAVIPFYACYRAVVRGKVHALESDEPDVAAEQRARSGDAACQRFALALNYARPTRAPALIVMCGLTGSGKSFVANALAARLGAAVVSSDAVRREMLGAGETPVAADSQGPYADERRRETYVEIRHRARAHLECSRSVVLDATHERRAERDAARDLAREMGVASIIVHVEEAEDVTRARLEARAAMGGSISGGTWEVYEAQRRRFESPRRRRARARRAAQRRLRGGPRRDRGRARCRANRATGVTILVVNAGSASLKVSLHETESDTTGVVREWNERLREGGYAAAFERIAREIGDEALDAVDAAGHRIVNGGAYTEPVLIDEAVRASIVAAEALAPLHNHAAIEALDAVRLRLPALPMVAVFDTGFHASMPEIAARYALPTALAEQHRIRRYGYHGIAHRSMLEQYALLANKPPEACTIITLQLGGGCSACAIRDGRSVDTSMGFTPLEGLMMATRSGSIDPAIVTYLQRTAGLSPDDVDAVLNERSGLLGVSRLSGDVAELLRAEAAGNQDAAFALEMFCYRVRQYIGAYMAVVEAEAIVFAGGIGEHAAGIRRPIIEPLAHLGLTLDPDANARMTGGAGRIDQGGTIAVWVVETDEAAIIARETARVLRSQ